MKIGCCTSIGFYDALVEAGYDAISLSGRELYSMSEEQFEETVRKIKAGPLMLSSLNAFCGPQVRLCGRGHQLSLIAEYTQALCKRANRLGVRYLGIGSPNSRKIEDGYPPEKALEEFEQSLSEICRITAQYSIEVLLEALATIECNCVTTTGQALETLRRLSLPNLHLVYDIYHAYMMNESPEELAMAIEDIACVHISRPNGNERCYLNQECMTYLSPFLDRLEKEGYQGELSLEAFSGTLPAGFQESIALLRPYQTRETRR